jgi:ribosomal protein S18 acetylase RimI-like enzyme
MPPTTPLSQYARLDEARAALGCSEVAPASLPIAGGMACRGAKKSWINTALNLGLREGDAGVVTPEDVDRLTGWYLGEGIDAKVEVSCHAHESLLKLLGERGYVPTMFETTFVRDISAGERIDALVPLGEGLRIEELRLRTAPADEPRCRELAWCVNRAFIPSGAEVRESDVEVSLNCMRHERTRSFAAINGAGEVVGGGYLEVISSRDLAKVDPTWADAPEVRFGALFGAAVAEPFRRRGVQQALLVRRLREAQAAGCEFVIIGGMPGAGTERNVRRYGFKVACYKVHMVKSAAK